MSKETQWAALKQLGFSDKACAVIMGHAMAESGCECNRVQGDFSTDRSKSKVYTAQVDDRQISEDDFVFRGPGGGGYGWLQWTHPSRKEGLYDTADGLCVSIGSEEAAIEWFWTEVHQPEYAAVWNALISDKSIREISDVFMKKFERPADQSEAACAYRAKLCEDMYNEFAGQPPAKPLAKDPVQATFPPSPSIKQIQYVMWDNDYWPIEEINGYKSARFFEKLREFVKDMEKS